VPVHIWPGTDDPARPRLVAPPGARDTFRRVVGAWGNDDLIEHAFELEEYAAGDEVTIGELTASFHPVPHFIDTFAVNLSAGDGRKLTYSADTSPGDEIVETARDADLLVVEATLPRPERTGQRGHLTPGEAGDHAKRAGARRVVLTHISDELGEDWAKEEAEKAYGGPVEVAREGVTYEI
jgi:ribonuclease BN (tRNA processing enzyme)